MSAPCVFVDRDGTLIVEKFFLGDPAGIEIFPDTPGALRALRDRGFRIVVISNQSGVARGYFTEDAVREVHRVLEEQLEALGVKVDAYYYCPHHPGAPVAAYDVNCECRKPKPGQLLAAARDLDLDLAHSYMIGDRGSDVDAGVRAGCTSVLVLTGMGQEALLHKASWTFPVAYIAPSIGAAADWIIQDADANGAPR